MLAVWTEVVDQKFVLKSADSREGVCSDTKILTALGGENLSPIIAHDLAGDA